MMVDDHKEDVDNFEEEVKDGNDADLKAFASKTLPVLNKHLTSIKAIQDGMKK
jgi:putative membrane protein